MESTASYKHLEKLTFIHGSVTSLTGLERFKNLKFYEHSYGKNLVDITVVTQLPNLEELRFEHCKKIRVDNIFERCHSLKRLFYFSCPDIQSLSFLKKMKSIEGFRFGKINILDGDLTPLLALKDFAFYPNKRSYSHTEEELKEIQKKMQ